MEKSCRNYCLACRTTGALSLRPVFVEEQWVGNAVSDRGSVPGSCFQASVGGMDLTAVTLFVFRNSSKFSRVRLGGTLTPLGEGRG